MTAKQKQPKNKLYHNGPCLKFLSKYSLHGGRFNHLSNPKPHYSWRKL